MLIPVEEDVLKEARVADNNIIKNDSKLGNILPSQLKNMTSWDKCMCGCECCISAKSMNYLLLSWHECYFKTLKYQSCNTQNSRSSEIENSLFEIYINSIMTHGKNILKT